MRRLFIFTGKGGVGKSTIAAAHALKSARDGHKTLLVSTDMAHNLGDIFEEPMGQKIVTIEKDLDILEIDPHDVMANDFPEMKAAFLRMINTSGLPLGELETMAVFPGMDELFSLLKMMAIYEEEVYDHIIVDCAPTGETLTLLKFPEMLMWYMEKFFPIGKMAMRVLSPLSKVVLKVQLPDQKELSDIESFFYQLAKLQDLLKDPEMTSIRLVAMAEKMVLEEMKRSYMAMNLFDFHVEGLYMNRVLPETLSNPFFDQWLELQKAYIEAFEQVFQPLPIYKIPWFGEELVGREQLTIVIEGPLDIKQLFDPITPDIKNQYTQVEEGYILSLSLPFASKEAIDFHESQTDLIVKIGNFKRSIPKPNALRNYHVVKATMEDQKLLITLRKE